MSSLPVSASPSLPGDAARQLAFRVSVAVVVTATLVGTAVSAGLGLGSSKDSNGTAIPVNSATSAVPHTPGFVRGVGVLRLGEAWTRASGYGRYSQLIVSREFAARASRLRGQSLVHFTGTDVNVRYSTGVPYGVAARKGWILRDGAGDVLSDLGYPGNYIGDVGNPAYQAAWAANVLRFLRVNKDSGVMIDNVLRDIKPLAGTYPARYPSQPQWAAAMSSFVRGVGRVLRSHGFVVAVNAVGYTQGDPRGDDGTLDLQWWRRLAPNVDVFVNEYYQQLPSGDNALRTAGSDGQEHWDGWQRLIVEAQSLHRSFVGITYGDSGDTRTMTYGRASFLMEWNGGDGAFVFNPRDNSDPWSPVWTADVGTPAAPKQAVGSGWLRRYSKGIALVNPSGSDSQAFDLGRPYRAPDGSTVSQITLQPATGAILLAR